MRYIGKFTNGKVFDKNTGGAPVSEMTSFSALSIILLIEVTSVYSSRSSSGVAM